MARFDEDDRVRGDLPDERAAAPRHRYDELERRDGIMQRRLRHARGEEVEDEVEDGYYDDYEDPAPYPQFDRGYPQRYSRPSGCVSMTLYLILGVLAVVLVILIVGRQFINGVIPSVNLPERVRQIIVTPTPTILDRGGTIQQIRNLDRLETQSFSVERVVEAGVNRGNFLDAFLGDRLLLIASGNVVAGVDLSKLKDSDVNISSDGKNITLRLPPSEVFQAALDNNRTRVYDRQTGILANQQKDLETQARVEAEGQILQAACEGGITQKAADEAKRSMEQFLSLLKFDTVTIIAPVGPCTAPTAVPTLPTATP